MKHGEVTLAGRWGGAWEVKLWYGMRGAYVRGPCSWGGGGEGVHRDGSAETTPAHKQKEKRGRSLNAVTLEKKKRALLQKPNQFHAPTTRAPFDGGQGSGGGSSLSREGNVSR